MRYLNRVLACLPRQEGRFVLSSVSHLTLQAIKSNQRLKNLNIYPSEREAVQALEEPPIKRSLGSAQ
jgi:hypothetical protein